MTLAVNPTIRTAQAQLLADAINAGAGPGKIRLYTASRPVTGGTPTTLICECVLHDPVEASLTAGALVFGTIADGLVLPAGTSTAAWGRIVDSDDRFVGDFDVSDLNGNGDLKLSSVTFNQNDYVRISGATLTVG